ncbi:MAG: hypothetical protein GWN71_36340, partial [Gammaproteobacteria bacterium]|nr:hypothetical protein [Gemmatimonadota bacterium]NIU78827.1 hypothetical protein [Gammaproteobacteria bacterium]
MSGSGRVRGAALAAVAACTLGGCVPWTLGQTAETLEPGRLGLGAGAAALMPPVEPREGLPVGQLWAGIGVLDGLEIRVDYVVPATVHGGLKARPVQAPQWALAATVGLGVHRIPALEGYDIAFRNNFATAAVILSGRHEARRPYTAVRAVVPFVTGPYPGAALWMTGV